MSFNFFDAVDIWLECGDQWRFCVDLQLGQDEQETFVFFVPEV